MPHDVSLISALAYGFGLALILGFIAARLKLPALVGYLLAGILIGPATPGFVTDTEIAGQLAEIGVMLLMFGVGLHFSLNDLLSVKRIALPGAIVQMTVATLLGMGLAAWWGWSLGAGLIFGLSLSVASTVVLLKALEINGSLDTMDGKIAVGWLVVEDLAMVLVLVLLPPLAGILGGTQPSATSAPMWQSLGTTMLLVATFVVLMLVVGRKLLPGLLWHVAHTGSRELFTLSVIAIAISIAFISSEVFGVSFALGAFFAGMVMRESEFSHRAAEESLPLRDAFSVLFFVSVGTLFDPAILLSEPLHVLAVLGVIIVGKSIAAAILVLAFKYPLKTALIIAASLAQIGEFSFILIGLGMTLGLLPAEGQSLILAGALLSIAINPFVFAMVDPLSRQLLKVAWLRRLDLRQSAMTTLPMSTEDKYLQGQVVIVGYGRVGRRISTALQEKGIPFVIAEQNRELVESLRKEGFAAVSGDAADPAVLIQAHIAQAAMLVIAAPDTLNVLRMVETARTLNPTIEIVLRTHNQEEAELWQKEKIGKVFFDEEELARGITYHVLRYFPPAPASSH